MSRGGPTVRRRVSVRPHPSGPVRPVGSGGAHAPPPQRSLGRRQVDPRPRVRRPPPRHARVRHRRAAVLGVGVGGRLRRHRRGGARHRPRPADRLPRHRTRRRAAPADRHPRPGRALRGRRRRRQGRRTSPWCSTSRRRRCSPGSTAARGPRSTTSSRASSRSAAATTWCWRGGASCSTSPRSTGGPWSTRPSATRRSPGCRTSWRPALTRPSVDPGHLVEPLQQVVRGQLHGLVPPLGGSVDAGDQARTGGRAGGRRRRTRGGPWSRRWRPR